MFLTFNELVGEPTVVKNRSDAKTLIDEFVQFCHILSDKNIVDEIIFPATLHSIYLYDEYGIFQWLNDKNVEQNHQKFFRRFLDKHRKYFNLNNTDGEFTVSLDNKDYNALGCAFALEHEHILLSLPTHEFWKNKTIYGKYLLLGTDNEIHISKRPLNNICTNVSQEEIISAYRKELSDDITSGQDLWEKRQELYPNLVFCENVKDQLYEDPEKYHIAAVMKRLNRFQEYFSDCENIYDPKNLGMDARTESATVKSDPQLKNYRKFRLPDGKEEYFFDHVGFTGKYSGGRIHFLPDNINKKCYIGYIGKHLPTKQY